MRMLQILGFVAVSGALCGFASGQTRYLIDFGDDQLQTGTRLEVWNDVHTKNADETIPLVDSAGNPTTAALTWVSPMGRAELTGVTVPEPGSDLEQLGWPASATSDSLYADSVSSVPEGELEITGLDPEATYDLTILGSVLGAPDLHSTEYTAYGSPPSSAVGPVTENTGEIERLLGLHADGAGTLRLRIRNATTNDHVDRRFYVNAALLVEYPLGLQPPLVSFDLDRLDTSRLIPKGPFQADFQLYTNNQTYPACSIEAYDLVTGLPPTWLNVLPIGTVGKPLQLALNPTGLSPREYVARVFATAPGYAPASMEVRMSTRGPGRLNLLFYGNSYSATNGSVNVLVDLLADEAGFEVPLSVPRYGKGKNLSYHLNLAQSLAIDRSFPLGEEWDWVVMQGGTLEAAATAGNTPNFVANGVQIMDNVRLHSPGALAVIYQTWARGAGHSLYTAPTPTYPGGPLQMHLELEDGNQQLADAIDAAYGPGTAVIAAAGESSALRGFDPSFYKADLSHPSNELTIQAGTTIFTRIFGQGACELEVDWDTPGPLANHLISLGQDEQAWRDLAGIADRSGDPSLRAYPGSSEDLLLEFGEPGATTFCGIESIPAGSPVRFELTSPAGSYSAEPVTLYFDVLGATGGSTFAPPWPEVHFTESASIQALASSLGSGGLAVELSLGTQYVGSTLLVQGMSEGASASTGNAFTLSDAKTLRVLAPLQQTPFQQK